ncbi:hypothetical protein [Plasmodium yoelii yoelii]|uniref:Peptidase S54 rhomboid domain-containing protein n=1 Tax=Plasmodium yoelii yoelii TaxID=73239 RepID=Q7RJ86_PLAYO|nr:hypothetical protein [Plasmodium yoelii yoelii]
MRFLMNYQNIPNDDVFDDSELLLIKYARSFYKTFKKNIKFIQILFPSYKPHYVTIIFSIFLYIFFFGYNIYFFNKYNPLFIREDVLINIGINREIISNKLHFHKLITATLVHPNIWSLIIWTDSHYSINVAQLGTSTILSGIMGLFLQEVTSNFKKIKGKIEIIGTYLFTIVPMYLTIAMFPHNGNIMGNLGGLFGGYCYPYIFNVIRMNRGPGNTARLVHIGLMGLFLISYLYKCKNSMEIFYIFSKILNANFHNF